MDLDLRKASLLKTKIFMKWHKLFFLLTGKNTNYKDGLILEQTFKSTDFIANKTINRDAKKIIEKSIYYNLDKVITSTVFLSKPKKELKFLIKNTIIDKFESASFSLLVIKLNQKLYYPNTVKSMNFLNYMDNKLFFFQFLWIQRKVCFNTLKEWEILLKN